MRRQFGWMALGLGLFVQTGIAQEKPMPTEAEKAAIAEIKKLGGNVLEIAQNDSRLDVAFHLIDPKINDTQLALVKNLPRTASLNLRGTEITDGGLANIKDLKGLTKLYLEKTKITDAGLEQLKGLENLEYLNLYGCPGVTDAGLKHLEGLKKLKKIYLWQTPVTDAGAAALKAAIPEIKIDRGQELPKPEPKPEEKKEEKKP